MCKKSTQQFGLAVTLAVGVSAVFPSSAAAQNCRTHDDIVLIDARANWHVDLDLDGAFEASRQHGLPGQDECLGGEPLATLRDGVDELVVFRRAAAAQRHVAVAVDQGQNLVSTGEPEWAFTSLAAEDRLLSGQTDGAYGADWLVWRGGSANGTRGFYLTAIALNVPIFPALLNELDFALAGDSAGAGRIDLAAYRPTDRRISIDFCEVGRSRRECRTQGDVDFSVNRAPAINGDVGARAMTWVGAGVAGLRDADCDGVRNGAENYLATPTSTQADLDGNGLGHALDADDDNDGVPDVSDNRDPTPIRNQAYSDGDNSDNAGEKCPTTATRDQISPDGDRFGTARGIDSDNDGVADTEDAFPFIRTACCDADQDGCDDCSSGVFDPLNDGVDEDGDGLCDPPPFLLAGEIDLQSGARPIMVADATAADDAQSLVVVANYGKGTLSFAKIDASGCVTQLMEEPVGTASSAPRHVVVNDVDGDQRPDVWVATTEGIFVSRRESGSSFGAAALEIAGPTTFVAREEMSGDVASCLGSPTIVDTAAGYDNGSLTARLGDGSGTNCNGAMTSGPTYAEFSWLLQRSSFMVSGSTAIVAGQSQFVESGEPPYVATFIARSECSGFCGNGTLAHPVRWDKDSSVSFSWVYQELPEVPLTEIFPTSVASFGDGIAVTIGSPGLLTVLRRPYSDGSRRTSYWIGAEPIAAIPVDLVGDSRPEMLTIQRADATVRLLRQSSTIALSSYAPLTLSAGSAPGTPGRCDVNGDQQIDLVIPLFAMDQVQIWLNNADGSLADCNANGVWDSFDIRRGSSQDVNQDGIPDECAAPILLGDLNCDGAVTLSDIAPFVLALTNPAGYAAQFPACDIGHADVNGDGMVSPGDIGAFIALLIPPTSLPGDTNCDGAVTVGDIGSFALALTNAADYATQFPDCDITSADTNGDGSITVSDIAAFVQKLTGG